jgi:hypothetical protein
MYQHSGVTVRQPERAHAAHAKALRDLLDGL